MATTIRISNLSKNFGKVTAVNDVSLDIEAGSFLTLLGPSGCGKTTLLRCVAGLEDPDSGDIFIGDKLVYSHARGVSLPSGKRDLGLVFQNYALWPHMKVDKNITFALEVQKLGKEVMKTRMMEALAEVKMEGFEDRYPCKKWWRPSAAATTMSADGSSNSLEPSTWSAAAATPAPS